MRCERRCPTCGKQCDNEVRQSPDWHGEWCYHGNGDGLSYGRVEHMWSVFEK